MNLGAFIRYILISMNTEKYRDYDVEGFLMDDGFLQWVKHPDPESDRFWQNFQELYPEKKKLVSEAVWILRSLQAAEPEIARQRLDDLFHSIQRKGSSSYRIGRTLLRAAAVILLLASLGVILFYTFGEKRQVPYEMAGGDAFEKGRIILPDGTVREFETSQTNIHQTTTGGITLNNDTIVREVKPLKTDKPAMNQVIIPYGKRSQITLADGTQIWLNSGSQLIYPATFEKGSREVYLTGEAYFDVTPDPSRPFYVITQDLKVRVLGTRFNVSSYHDDPSTQTVLVSGKVSVGRNRNFSKPVELVPGERILYKRSDQALVKDKVEINRYVSWIDGYMIFENEPVSELFKKLGRFYNSKIIIEQGIENITFSGKLDLACDLQKVFENIAFSSPIEITNMNEVFTIKPKGL